eukprot:5482241-Alexandrium_andersonii.AAC.1
MHDGDFLQGISGAARDALCVAGRLRAPSGLLSTVELVWVASGSFRKATRKHLAEPGCVWRRAGFPD